MCLTILELELISIDYNVDDAFDVSLLQLKKLDDSEFRNAFSRAYVRVCINLGTFCIATLCIFPSFIIAFDYRLGNMIRGGIPLGALVVVDLTQEAGVTAVVVAIVVVGAGAWGLTGYLNL